MATLNHRRLAPILAMVMSRLPSLALVAGLSALASGPLSCGSNPPRDKPARAARLEGDLRSFGARGDGEADDTEALQRAVDSGIGGVYLARGVYRITRPIIIELQRVGFTSILGDGTATIVMDGPGPALRFVGTHEGTASPETVKPGIWKRQRTPMVDAIEIVGAHEEASGIEAEGTLQLTLTRVVVRQALHGIHLVKRNRNVSIASCHIYENRGAGIFYDHVNLHQSNITGCHISYNRAGGVVIRGGDVRNVQLGSCDIEGNMSPEGPRAANVLLDSTGGSIGEVAIVGCTIQHDHDAPGSANIRIEGLSTPRPFTEELRHGNITISDNVLSDVQINVDLQDTRGVALTGNTMWKGYTNDLRIRGSSSVVVADNVLDRNPRYHYGDGKSARRGILIEDSSDLTISGNHILGTGDVPAAIVLRRCRRLNVTNCTVLDARRAGMRLEDVSDSRVSDCLVQRDDRSIENAGSIDDDSPTPVSLEVIGGQGNMIVDNLLGSPPVMDRGAAHAEGNVYPGAQE